MDKVKELKNNYDQRAKYAQLKRDGYRLKITKNAAGVVTAWTRKPKNWTEYLKRIPAAEVLWTKLKPSSTLHAEIWKEGTPATSIISCVQAGDPKLRVSVFAVASGLHERASLTDFAFWCKYYGLDYIPYYVRGEREAGCLGTFTSLEDLPKPHVGGDVEGYVFKDYNSSYLGEGWQKWTKVRKLTLKVTDLKDGKGKYANQVGSLVCSDANNIEVCAVSGFTDIERLNLSPSDIGRAIEVSYKGIASNGRLRMPRFFRFRDDIDPVNVDKIGNDKVR